MNQSTQTMHKSTKHKRQKHKKGKLWRWQILEHSIERQAGTVQEQAVERTKPASDVAKGRPSVRGPCRTLALWLPLCAWHKVGTLCQADLAETGVAQFQVEGFTPHVMAVACLDQRLGRRPWLVQESTPISP
eukprot:1003732-Amphidinium_carterae.1